MKDQRTGKAEKMLYGKIRITEDIVLKAGDEVYVFLLGNDAGLTDLHPTT